MMNLIEYTKAFATGLGGIILSRTLAKPIINKSLNYIENNNRRHQLAKKLYNKPSYILLNKEQKAEVNNQLANHTYSLKKFKYMIAIVHIDEPGTTLTGGKPVNYYYIHQVDADADWGWDNLDKESLVEDIEHHAGGLNFKVIKYTGTNSDQQYTKLLRDFDNLVNQYNDKLKREGKYTNPY